MWTLIVPTTPQPMLSSVLAKLDILTRLLKVTKLFVQVTTIVIFSNESISQLFDILNLQTAVSWIMVDVTSTLFVRITKQTMLLNVHAKLVTLTLDLVQMSFAPVKKHFGTDWTTHRLSPFFFMSIDSCLVKNGGCDVNAICSHDNKTFGIICTCKTGYSNTGSTTNVTCTGKYLHRTTLNSNVSLDFSR